jgi:hypothetical protein
MFQPETFIVFRVLIRVEIGLRRPYRLKFGRPTCPSWASASSWCEPERVLPASREPVTLDHSQVRRQTHKVQRSTDEHPPELPPSHEGSLPSQGSSPSTDFPVWGRYGAGLFGFRLFASALTAPHGTLGTSLRR